MPDGRDNSPPPGAGKHAPCILPLEDLSDRSADANLTTVAEKYLRHIEDTGQLGRRSS